MDMDAFRREILRHCLWMASLDVEYAQWSAERYESESCGALVGLGEKVRAAIAKHIRGSKEMQRRDQSPR